MIFTGFLVILLLTVLGVIVPVWPLALAGGVLFGTFYGAAYQYVQQQQKRGRR